VNSEEKKALVASFFDRVWCQHDLDYIDEIYRDDFQLNALWQNTSLGGSGQATGPQSAKDIIGRWIEGFPDIRVTVEEQVAEGEFVACRHWSIGTHTEDFMGMNATNKPGKMSGMTITQVTDGKVAAAWTCWDVSRMMQAIGVAPAPPDGPYLNEDAAEEGPARVGDPEDPEEAKRLVQRYYEEIWSGADLKALEEVLAPDFLGRVPGRPTLRGPDDVAEVIADWRDGMGDLTFEVQAQHAEGGRVCTRYTASGTHSGTFMDLPASGKEVRTAGVVISRVRDGKIASEWGEVDIPGLLGQVAG
jgi:steroid delta-isomerase-like uncharacterized protein